MEEKDKKTLLIALGTVLVSPLLVLVIGFLCGVILALPCMWIYNALVASLAIAGMPVFTFWQWVLIIALAKIIFAPASAKESK